MTTPEAVLPDIAGYNGQAAIWEGARFGYRAVFEALVDPSTFCEPSITVGDGELIELYEPTEDTSLTLTFLDDEGEPRADTDPITLNAENRAAIIQSGLRFTLDATASTEPFAYTCVLYGEEPKVDRLNYFEFEGKLLPVQYRETTKVKDGVTCDVYRFVGDDEKDLGIINIKQGTATPAQRILDGDTTLEGFISGESELVVLDPEDNLTSHPFSEEGDVREPIEVTVGEVMQWVAHKDTRAYEICYPPYEGGRFEDLA
jgi:hypothetical protein